MATDRAGRSKTSRTSRTGSSVCIGHSHAGALAAAAKALGRDVDSILFWSEAGAIDPDGSLRADLAERVRRARRVVAAVGGSSAAVIGLVEYHRAFDFVLPSEPDLPLDPDRELVPADVVRAALAAEEAKYEPMLEQLKALSVGPVVQIESPPPVYDNGFIVPHVPWSLWPDQPRIVAPPALRYKLWRLSSEVLAATCARLGVIFQPAPKASMDAKGFLRPGLSTDGIHADVPYGQMFWDDLGP
jgi:hypothetical protein